MRGLFVAFIAFFGLTAVANAQCAAGYTQLSNVFACQQNTGGAPVITSPSSATGTVGTPFSYQITATNSPTSWNATGLPSPLTVATGTGLISGTPSAPFSGTVGLSATNASGTGTQNLALTINASGPVPIFTDVQSGSCPNWAGVGMRSVFLPAALSPAPGKTKIVVKIGVRSGTTAGLQLIQAWIGETGGPNEYDFNGSQVRLTFGGSNSFTLAGGAQTFVSDPVTFTYSPSAKLVLAIDWNGNNSTQAIQCANQANSNVVSYYQLPEQNNANASTVTMSGFAAQPNPFVYEIDMQ